MKEPISKKQVVIEYWDCGIDSHRHKKEEIARRCIESRELSRRPVPQSVSRHCTELRNCEIFERLIIGGEKASSLGLEYGLSVGSIHQIARYLFGWSLYRAGISTFEEAKYTTSDWRKRKDKAVVYIEKLKTHAKEILKTYECMSGGKPLRKQRLPKGARKAMEEYWGMK